MEQMENLSLSWDAHQKSICNGLCKLQQRGEFVDMTLAADGHHVKVHQMVLSLVSPYIKDLISTAKCPHPVIFLNNISYSTLSAILEYVYTGEVLVPKYQLPEIIAAGRALHIRGLKEMDSEKTAESDLSKSATPTPTRTKSISERLRLLKEKKKPTQPQEEKKMVPAPICRIYLDEDTGDSTRDIPDYSIDIQDDSTEAGDTTLDGPETGTPNCSNNIQSPIGRDLTAEDTKKVLLNSKVQYTVSNQGGLQIMYNRYLYQLRYISKGTRKISWRCIGYDKTKCTAHIFTNDDDEVVERTFYHNHSFHDKNILRKHRMGTLYSRFQDAKLKSESIKKNVADRMNPKAQYTVSNQGGLQIMYNRYLYQLRYISKRSREHRKISWRCIDYNKTKCTAQIFTNDDDEVVERTFKHNHTFHDKNILRKHRMGTLYSRFQDAKLKTESIKKNTGDRIMDIEEKKIKKPGF